MAEEATVVLKAEDQLSIPVLKAVAALQQLQGALNDIVAVASRVGAGTKPAADGLGDAGEAAAHSVAPHHAAHKALSLVSGSLVEMAGGSAAAGAGVKVLDSIMFQMAMTGGAVSLQLVAIIAAAAAVGYAFKASSEETKKQQEFIDKLTSSVVAHVRTLEYLNSAQKSVAGVGLAQLSQHLQEVKNSISDLTGKMAENQFAVEEAGRTGGETGSLFAKAAADARSLAASAGLVSSASDAAAKNQIKWAGELRVLRAEAINTQHEIDTLTTRTEKYQSKLREISNPIQQFINASQREARSLEEVGRALGNVSIDYGTMAASAASSGQSIVDMATLAQSQTKAMDTAIFNSAIIMGEAIGNAIGGAKNAWRDGIKGMVLTFLDAVQAIIIAAMAANMAVTAIFTGPIGIGIGIAALAAVGALKAGLSATMNKGMAATTATSKATKTASGAAGGGATGPGGSAVATAQREVQNNIVVNLPVQALDLASISDMTMKAFAFRVGKVIREAAATGQLSLVGS